MKKGLILTAAFLMIGALVFANGNGEDNGGKPQIRFATIGTGGVTGVYYPAGGAISKMVNKKSDVYGLKVTVESTGGSVFNINAVIAGDLEFGIAQSDRQTQAWEGTDEWKDKGPRRN